jgi:hypothetical protein
MCVGVGLDRRADVAHVDLTTVVLVQEVPLWLLLLLVVAEGLSEQARDCSGTCTCGSGDMPVLQVPLLGLAKTSMEPILANSTI